MCRHLAKQHVDGPDVPAAPDGANGCAEWVQVVSTLSRVDLEKSLRETGDYLNEMPGILAVFDLDETPHYSSLCRFPSDRGLYSLARLRSGKLGGYLQCVEVGITDGTIPSPVASSTTASAACSPLSRHIGIPIPGFVYAPT